MQGSETMQAREAVGRMGGLWWLWLVAGILWTVAAVVILQFDQASITTVGVIIGIMFVGAGVQSLTLASMVEEGRVFHAIFGTLFLVASVIAFISPENTFTAMADILGFLFLLVGVSWLIQGFMMRGTVELWWLSLIAGSLMIILAFWTGGQFYIEKAYTLLVFAGIWALMLGITNIVRAFEIRRLGKTI